MGKKKSPSPPKLAIPQPSAEEIALMKQQTKLVEQLTKQSDISFNQGQDDRAMAFQHLEQLQRGDGLTEAERSLSDQLADAYFEQASRGINQGANQEIFNDNLKTTLAGLNESGILNSTTGADALGQLSKDKLRLIADASNNAGLQKLLLQRDFLGNKQQMFGALMGVSQQSRAQGGQLAQGALSGAGQVAGQHRQYRMDAFNVRAQNAQAQYQHKLGQFQQSQASRKGLGGTIGTIAGLGLGALLAAPTGGLSIAAGASLGGGIGGSIGSSLF